MLRGVPVSTAMMMTQDHAVQSRIAVLVPCYDEELTIAKVVTDFRVGAAGSRYLRVRQQFS
jgi:hypothetical protein